MKIEKNKMVSLIYELRENNPEGKIIEVLDESRPLTFLYGAGRLLPVFEDKINLLEAGDKFSFALDSKSAYGEQREDMIINIPLSVFETDGRIDEELCRVGNTVPMVDNSGNPLNGTIIEISESFVMMDFNHPMAGVDLHFSGKILNIREATEEEIAGNADSCSSCGSARSNSGCGGSCSC
jgi:FKBP-type peptidyl-prolyl cis-trans isomerase SlyD